MIPKVIAALAALSLSAGCASSSHTIPQGELMDLSQRPPEERGKSVRVIQDLGGEAPPSHAPPVGARASVYVAAPIWVGGTPRARHSPRASGSHQVVSHSSSRFGGLAEARKGSAKAWYVVAAVVAGALVFTEGIRYDGWVDVHPMHPVHLYGYDGSYTWMPLAHITPDVAAWSEKAVLRAEEGPWQPLGRAPLSRQGWSYSLLLGAGEVALIGADPRPGFLGHIQLGYYPLHVFGIQADIAYGWADDARGATVFDGRYALELDFLPLAAGPFHGGVFGQLGIASRSDDGIGYDDSDTLVAGGGKLQLELTTRLALTLKAGLTAVHDETLSELTLGISIY